MSTSKQAKGPRSKVRAAQQDISESARVVSAASSKLREQDLRWRESLDEVELGLLTEKKVPAWTIKFHSRMGHFGGFALFVLGSVIFWPVLAVVAWQLLVVFGTRIVNDVPSLVLSELNVNSTTVATRTDSFVFSWVMPVLFFVIVLAGLALWLFRAVVRVSARYSSRLAQGLFAGYGTGLRADFTAIRLNRAVRRKAAEQKRERVARVRESAEDQ